MVQGEIVHFLVTGNISVKHAASYEIRVNAIRSFISTWFSRNKTSVKHNPQLQRYSETRHVFCQLDHRAAVTSGQQPLSVTLCQEVVVMSGKRHGGTL